MPGHPPVGPGLLPGRGRRPHRRRRGEAARQRRGAVPLRRRSGGAPPPQPVHVRRRRGRGAVGRRRAGDLRAARPRRAAVAGWRSWLVAAAWTLEHARHVAHPSTLNEPRLAVYFVLLVLVGTIIYDDIIDSVIILLQR